MRIAIDAMGGDNAPREIVQGVIDAAPNYPNYEFILVGNENKIKETLTEDKHIANIKIHHAEDIITGDDEPVRAVRRKKDASMVVCARLVKDKEAEAMITAGNTGAFLAAGLLIVGRLPGVQRPALAPIFPSTVGQGTMVLDVGANMDARPEYLYQHAVLGSIYMQQMMGIASPRVGLANIGTEPGKGNDLVKEVYDLLEKSNLNFVGNVESRDIMADKCDVLVCDGFTGNIILKTLEGAASTIFGTLKADIKASLRGQLGGALLLPIFKGLNKKLDYREVGGAPLLGLNGACIKSHGSSDRYAIVNAIKQTSKFLDQDTLALMIKELANRSEIVE